MEIDITKEELRILMDCVTITKESISNRMVTKYSFEVMVPKEAIERLEKFDLEGIWLKLCGRYFQK